MMDLKEIIKWFIPCFHLLVVGRAPIMDTRLTFVFLFLLLNLCASFAANINSAGDYRLRNSLANNTKNYNVGYSNVSFLNKPNYSDAGSDTNFESRELEDGSVGRTFGRPMKKMMQALIPLAFQMGMAATWAVVAALVGIKTLGVTLVILKLLLIAGALKMIQTVYASLPMVLATVDRLTRRIPQPQPLPLQKLPPQIQNQKVGSFFGHKTPSHGWEQPQPHNKEIHLHIHNGQLGHGTEEHIPISPWSREGIQGQEDKHVNVVYDPYGGPQTLSTPYGHYMKIEPGQQ